MKTSMLTVLLTTAAITFAAPAQANDRTADLLAQPATAPNAQVTTITATTTPQTPVDAAAAPAPAARKSTPVTDMPASAPAAPAKMARPVVAPIVEGDPAQKAEVPAQKAEVSVAPQAAPAKTAPVPLSEQAAPAVFDAPATAAQQITMQEVLSRAYATNPTLKAERERLRIQYEAVSQADARLRPALGIEGGVAGVYAENDPGADDSFVRKDVGLTLTQPVWAGGRLVSYVDQQLKLSDAAIAGYESIGGQVFLDIVTAAMDVMRDRATIALNEKNYEVIAKQLDAAQKGFEVGELTRTDVSQARARLAGGDAALSGARSAYQSSLARFTQLTGLDASAMDFAHDAGSLPLPADLATSQTVAESENPAIIAARYQQQAADEGIDIARADMYPTLNIVGGADHQWEPSPVLDRAQGASLGLRASMNLYEGGATQSRIRQAKISQYEQQNRVDEVARAVRQQVATAWNAHHAARAQITAFEAQVESATIARNGVYKEREVGLRTVLDTLDAERELLDAEVGLVRARRDAAVADYALLVATGRLTPSRLGLFSQADEKTVRDSARGWARGSDVSPRN